MQMTAKLWDLSAEVGVLREDGHCPYFDIETAGGKASEEAGWRTASRFFLLDHDRIVSQLAKRPLLMRLARGLRSAAIVISEGGAFGYFRHAWRFGLFFVFPFLLVVLGLAISLALATYPLWLGVSAWHYPFGIALGIAFFLKLFLPFSERYFTLHLFSDWELAVAVARMDEAWMRDWVEASARAARPAFDEDADEYVITSHSMGSSMAVHTIGLLLEREPDLFVGKRVTFVTLGGAILQCALLRSATTLRSRVGAIARSRDVAFVEVQCLTDIISFYKSSVTALTGHSDAPSPRLIFLRIRNMLEPERYRRIKRDFLRVHRQYVLGSDRRTNFDFGLMTAGPWPAGFFADIAPGRRLDDVLAGDSRAA
ncbi:hypothetical protein SAMN03159496_03429 [Rhizobium sp. NFR07]|nr:hypothetical protein SAMN03159496_03429 [Rhizobium sp. NFR07]